MIPLSLLTIANNNNNNNESQNSSSVPNRPDYDEGLDFGPQLLDNDATTLSNHVDATILYNLGRLYCFQSKHEKAMRTFGQALSRCSSSFVDASTTTTTTPTATATTAVATLLGVAQIHYLYNHSTNAIMVLETALSLATNACGPESLPVAAVLNCMGVVRYSLADDTEKALEALETSLRLHKAILGPHHLMVGTNLYNLGRVKSQSGDYQGAVQTYRQALAVRQAVLGPHHVDVGATLFNQGQAHHRLGETNDAMVCFQQFLTIAQTGLGEFHRDVAVVQTCIGQVYLEHALHHRALESFHEALRIGRRSFGPMHPEIAVTLNKLGNVHYEMGQVDAALSAYQQGLVVEQAVLEPGHGNILVTLTNMAELHKQRRELDKALELFQTVLALQQQHFKAGDALAMAEMAVTLSSVGCCKHLLGDYAGALEYQQECLKLRRAVHGDVDEGVASALTRMAMALLKLRMQDVALEALEEACRIRQTLSAQGLRTCLRDTAFAWYNLALIHHQRGFPQPALRCFRETARVEQATLGQNHADLAITYTKMAELHYHMGDVEQALHCFERVLEIETANNNNAVARARTLNEIGNIALVRGNVKRMMECFVEALRIYRQCPGTDDSNLIVAGVELYGFEKTCSAPCA